MKNTSGYIFYPYKFTGQKGLFFRDFLCIVSEHLSYVIEPEEMAYGNSERDKGEK
jgi:hypothetical protein